MVRFKSYVLGSWPIIILDVVIYATGFDTTFKPPFKVTGLDAQADSRLA